MPRRLELTPLGWPLPLAEAPPGPFIIEGQLYIKTRSRRRRAGGHAIFDSNGFICSSIWDELPEVQPVRVVWTTEK